MISEDYLNVEAIGNSLENIKDTIYFPDWHRDYNKIKNNLLYCLDYDVYWDYIPFDRDELLEWKNEVSTWRTILEDNDVAMYPPCLHSLKEMFICEYDKEFCEDITRMSYCVMVEHNKNRHDMFKRSLDDYRMDYGVFRLRCVIGDNLLKLLRRHLRVNSEDFMNVYGLGLCEDLDCCDDLLIEMLVTGHLRGGVRSYKIESEYYS